LSTIYTTMAPSKSSTMVPAALRGFAVLEQAPDLLAVLFQPGAPQPLGLVRVAFADRLQRLAPQRQRTLAAFDRTQAQPSIARHLQRQRRDQREQAVVAAMRRAAQREAGQGFAEGVAA